MKILVIIGGILLAGFIGVQLFALKSQNNIEMYPYELVEQYDSFEIRRYQARLFSTVKLSTGDYKSSSGQGFSVLAGYIFGGNDRNEKIAMTSPVSMSLGDTPSMGFMVPQAISKEALPKPNQADITFKQEPQKTMAVITFSGWASDATIKEYKDTLIAVLKANDIQHTNQFYCFGYNPPYDLFFRKNEIAVVLKPISQN